MSTSIQSFMRSQVELSFVPPQHFFMVIENLPEVQFTAQKVQIPTMSLQEANLPNLFNPGNAFIPADGVDYGQLSIDFILDKQFLNYRSILKWMKGISKPESFDQYKEWIGNTTDSARAPNNLYSNITVVGTDAGLSPLVEWNFVDCYPISLDGPSWDTTIPDVEYMQTNATFRFLYFSNTTYNQGIKNDDTL